MITDLKAGQIKFLCKSAAVGKSCDLSVVVENEKISFLEAEPRDRVEPEEPRVAAD